VVKLQINKNKHEVYVPRPQLTYLNESVPLDNNTDVVVQKWKKIAEDNYASLGFDPKKVVMATGEQLDGRETEIRSRSTNLTGLITAAMAYACPKADVVIFNSGSIRLDDILTPPITQYDILRSLPFGGGIREVDMKGDMLLQVLQAGQKNVNSGGFLQSQPVVFNKTTNSFLVNNRPIDPSRTYRVALSDFLLSGKEANLAFLNETNPAIVKVYPAQTAVTNPQSDIRLAVITFLENRRK
jgi:2',3'-cyclic-nucleotide 2'-phosphodiesterase (5'-nucleotidase family)